MKRWTQFLALILAVVLLAGCSGNNAGTNGANNSGGNDTANDETTTGGAPEGVSVTAVEDTLTVAMVSEAAQLDPQGNAVTQPDAIINVQVYEGLVRMNNDTNEIEPWLAESWEQIDDSTLRVKLREGVLWQDGTELTTEDVLYTIQRGVQSVSKEYCWGAIDAENCEIIDKYTIDIRTFGAYPALLSMMVDNGWLIVNKNYFESNDYDYVIRNPMGTGPWTFSEWIAGDSISFVRNEDYWGEKPYFGNLVIRTIADDTTRSLALETGEVDYVIGIQNSQIEYLQNTDVCDVYLFPGMTLEYVVVNGAHEELSDVRVRQALRYAIDLDNMVSLAYGATATPADGIVTSANQFYVECPEELQYTYDLEKAKELMAEAGYENGFSATIICKDSSDRVAMCEMLKNAWAELNVDLEVQVMDIATYYDKVQTGDTWFALGGFVCLANDGDMYHDYFYSTQDVSMNYGSYQNPLFDELADAGRYEMDEEARREIYAEMQNLLREELPWIPVAYVYETVGVRSTLTGVDLDKNGQPRFQFVRPVSE